MNDAYICVKERVIHTRCGNTICRVPDVGLAPLLLLLRGTGAEPDSLKDYLSASLSTTSWITSSDSSSDSQGSTGRHLLQNNNVIWPRETMAIAATSDVINRMITSGNMPADGIKSGARGIEIARLASNKAVQPWMFDKVLPPPQPGDQPARLAAALGRRLLSV